MKIKTLPNGNMNLEGIEFVSQTGYHVTIGPYCLSNTGKPCHWLMWEDEDEPRKEMFEYMSIVDCFSKKMWRVKSVGKPTKIMKRFEF
jgi:hypothetical protein